MFDGFTASVMVLWTKNWLCGYRLYKIVCLINKRSKSILRVKCSQSDVDTRKVVLCAAPRKIHYQVMGFMITSSQKYALSEFLLNVVCLAVIGFRNFLWVKAVSIFFDHPKRLTLHQKFWRNPKTCSCFLCASALFNACRNLIF